MQTKHLCVLIHIRIYGEVGTVNMFKPSSTCISFTDRLKAVLILWILFLLFTFHVCLYCTVVAVPCSIVVTF